MCLHIACHWHLATARVLILIYHTAEDTLNIYVIVGQILVDLEIPRSANRARIYKALKADGNPYVDAYLASRDANKVAIHKLQPPLEVAGLITSGAEFTVQHVDDILRPLEKLPLQPHKSANDMFPDPAHFVYLLIENLPGKIFTILHKYAFLNGMC